LTTTPLTALSEVSLQDAPASADERIEYTFGPRRKLLYSNRSSDSYELGIFNNINDLSLESICALGGAYELNDEVHCIVEIKQKVMIQWFVTNISI
jgi:hypothetical protein